MEDLILYFSLKYNGEFQNIYDALVRKEKIDGQKKEKSFKKLNPHGRNYSILFNDDYPKELKEINCPPLVLCYYGDLLKRDSKVIVITSEDKKDISEYFKENSRDFSKYFFFFYWDFKLSIICH